MVKTTICLVTVFIVKSEIPGVGVREICALSSSAPLGPGLAGGSAWDSIRAGREAALLQEPKARDEDGLWEMLLYGRQTFRGG